MISFLISSAAISFSTKVLLLKENQQANHQLLTANFDDKAALLTIISYIVASLTL
jgi:hypothetical protein